MKITKVAFAATTALLLGGCLYQSQEPVRVVVENEVRTRPVDDQGFTRQADAPLKAAMGPAVTVFGKPVRQMAAEVEIALKKRGIKRLPIAITPFVDLDKPDSKHQLGNELAEGFFHELQVRGFNVVDHRALPFPKDKQSSAVDNLSDFYRRYKISYVLTGTYIVNSDGAILNARVLDTVTRQVVATGQSAIPTADLEGGLPGYDPLDSSDGMIIENGGVPVN